jgi:hypothetical protein
MCIDRTCLCWPPAPAGSVQLPSTSVSSSSGAGSATAEDGALPFLFDVAGMPDEDTACSHCQDETNRAVECCGVCDDYDGDGPCDDYPCEMECDYGDTKY